MRTLLGALVMVGLSAAVGPRQVGQARQTGQVAPACLHGTFESPADKTRREQALRVADGINMAEAALPAAKPRYQPFGRLPNLPVVPAGFKVQLDTNGDSYTFSIKDTRDRCRYAIFSDQEGRVYEALPPDENRVKLLSN